MTDEIQQLRAILKSPETSDFERRAARVRIDIAEFRSYLNKILIVLAVFGIAGVAAVVVIFQMIKDAKRETLINRENGLKNRYVNCRLADDRGLVFNDPKLTSYCTPVLMDN